MLAYHKTFKLSIIALSAAAFILFRFDGASVRAYSSGPPNGHTGAPGELTCATSGCHNSFLVNGGGGILTLAGLPDSYSPNQEINLAVTLNQPNRGLYGFQITVLDDAGKKAGDLIVTDSVRTQKSSDIINGSPRDYISHTFDGTSPTGTNQNSWTLKWKAPAQSAGQVSFYVAGNAANGSGDPSGDFIYTINSRIQPGATVALMANVSAASFAANGALAGDAIAAAFSTNMSTGTVVAATLPLPTELDGTQVKVRDATGNESNAQLFFVSPMQVNYLVPAGMANGVATVTARRGSVDIAQGTMSIESVAPGLFSANANGQGVAAAVAFRLKADGRQSFESVSQFNQAANRFDSLPIDLGPDTDQVFLIAYGTAFRRRSSLSTATCTIGGTSVPVTYADAAPGFVGLDQANIGPIPRALIGRGNAEVVFRVDNKTANIVTINIK